MGLRDMLKKFRGSASGGRHGEGAPILGARFKKLSDHRNVWIVERLFNPEGLKTHVALVCEGSEFERRIISESTLMDTHLYRREEVE